MTHILNSESRWTYSIVPLNFGQSETIMFIRTMAMLLSSIWLWTWGLYWLQVLVQQFQKYATSTSLWNLHYPLQTWFHFHCSSRCPIMQKRVWESEKTSDSWYMLAKWNECLPMEPVLERKYRSWKLTSNFREPFGTINSFREILGRSSIDSSELGIYCRFWNGSWSSKIGLWQRKAFMILL